MPDQIIFCPYCGAQQLRAGTRFCHICGQPIPAAPAVAPTPLEVTPARRRRPNAWWLLPLFLVAGVVLLFAAWAPARDRIAELAAGIRPVATERAASDDATPVPVGSASVVSTEIPAASPTISRPPSVTPQPTAAPTPTALPTPTPTSTPTPLPGPHLGVIADSVTNLRVRAGPGAGYFVLGKLAAGAAVTITGRTEDATWVQIDAGPERMGWVSSEYVEANYPIEGASVMAAPALPQRLLAAQASTDFSDQQGSRDWFYLISAAPGSLKFTRMPWDGGGWYRWCCDGNYNPQMRISDAGAYPSQRYDVARLWVSPYEGQLHIYGRAYKEAGAGRGGNGVMVRIVQNEAVLWERTLDGYDTTGAGFDLTAVSAVGDNFYFIVSALGNDTADNTVFDPTIELLHPEGVDMPAPARWADTMQATLAPTPAPVAALCFEPRLRHYEEHKGCCAEVAGLVYNRQGQPYGPRGAVLHIEGPPAADRYVREFGVDAGGGYNVTALSMNPYTIWLKGPNIRSKQYAVEYPDWAKIRIIVDFYQVACW